MTNVKSFKEYLEMDGSEAFNIAMFDHFAELSDRSYTEICGGFHAGVHQWVSHNIYEVDECENDKFFGWTLTMFDDSKRQVYIPRNIMEMKPTDWKHAKNLFNKYLKVVPTKH